jgi:hypothetical protein
MFNLNFFSKSKESTPISPEILETLVSTENSTESISVDSQWYVYLFPDVAILAPHQAEGAKNLLVTIENLFPAEYNNLKERAVSEKLSSDEIKAELLQLKEQIPEPK